MLCEQFPDLFVSVAALRKEVALMQNGTIFFRFSTDAREKNHLAGSGYSNDFGEASLRPFAIVVILLLESRARRLRQRRSVKRNQYARRNESQHRQSLSLNKSSPN